MSEFTPKQLEDELLTVKGTIDDAIRHIGNSDLFKDDVFVALVQLEVLYRELLTE